MGTIHLIRVSLGIYVELYLLYGDRSAVVYPGIDEPKAAAAVTIVRGTPDAANVEKPWHVMALLSSDFDNNIDSFGTKRMSGCVIKPL